MTSATLFRKRHGGAVWRREKPPGFVLFIILTGARTLRSTTNSEEEIAHSVTNHCARGRSGTRTGFDIIRACLPTLQDTFFSESVPWELCIVIQATLLVAWHLDLSKR